jgi:hypothetical protein
MLIKIFDSEQQSPTFVWEPQKAFSPEPHILIDVVFYHQKVILTVSNEFVKKLLKIVPKKVKKKVKVPTESFKLETRFLT